MFLKSLYEINLSCWLYFIVNYSYAGSKFVTLFIITQVEVHCRPTAKQLLQLDVLQCV